MCKDFAQTFRNGSSHYHVPFLKVLRKSDFKKIFKKIHKYQKIQFFVKFWRFQNFPGKTAVYVSCPYSKEHSCKKAKKSLARFSRKSNYVYRPGLKPKTDKTGNSKSNLNWRWEYIYSHANILRTRSLINLRFSQDGSWYFPDTSADFCSFCLINYS